MFQSFQVRPDQVKVLVVDDQPVFVKLLEEQLSAAGYRVVAATNGEDALDKVAAEHPTVVLLDVTMPGMDGFEVCRRIKSNPATLFLPVVLVTALTETENRVKGAEAGADDFLTKPVNESELFARVKSLARVKLLNDALQASNKQLSESVAERTRRLEQATLDLQDLLKEKAHFTANLMPATNPRAESPAKLAAAAAPAVGGMDEKAVRDFKKQILRGLSGTLEGRADLSRTPEIVGMLGQRMASLYEASGYILPDEARTRLFREIVDEILGYGPIEPLLADPTITEVMVNGPDLVYVERKGRLIESEVKFDDNDHVMRVIDRIIRPLGRRVDRNSPMVDARLPDGSRVNAIIPPCAIDGPSLTIRKFSKDRLQMEDLIKFGSITRPMADFLQTCVRGHLNIVVAGGTGSGKTTLLNVLSAYIPEGERIVTIEDSAELQLHQRHVVRMETKTADLDGSGEVTIRMLVRNSLRMRPDRIIVGEVRGGEALDMLQAMNTGHDGSLATVHANSPRDTIARLETLVLMAGLDLPLSVVRADIASAVDLIVQQSRLRDGSRKVVQITEVQGMEGDLVVLSDIFIFNEQGMEDGRVLGAMESTGIRPKFSEKLQDAGLRLPAEMFEPKPTERRGRK